MKSDANMCSQRTVNAVVITKAQGVFILRRKVGQEQKRSSPGPEVSYTHTSVCSCAKGTWKSQGAWYHHVPNHEYSTGPTARQVWMGSSGEPARAHEAHSEPSACPESPVVPRRSSSLPHEGNHFQTKLGSHPYDVISVHRTTECQD